MSFVINQYKQKAIIAEKTQGSTYILVIFKPLLGSPYNQVLDLFPILNKR